MRKIKDTKGTTSKILGFITPDEFWCKVNVGKPNECWEFIGYRNRDGYGMVQRKKRKVFAHRIAYCITMSQEIPQGTIIRHKCDNAACCNPDHLIAGSQKDNVNDMIERDRHVLGDRSKLTAYEATIIKAAANDMISKGKPLSTVAKELSVAHNVGPGMIERIVRGKVWKDAPDIWHERYMYDTLLQPR